MKRCSSAVLALAILTLGLAGPAAADDDDDDRGRDKGMIELLTREAAAITAGDTAWIAPNWTAEKGDVHDVRVELYREPGRGVEVSYPTNTATWTGLMEGPTLVVGEIDYTAIRVHVPDTFDKKHVDIDLLATYTNGEGDTKTTRAKVRVPVVQFTDGDHLVQHESVTEIAAGGSAWVDVNMTGLAPAVDNVTMVVRGELGVVYPAEGDLTSLHGDDRLQDGETDTARFRVDVGTAAPGSYPLETTVRYVFGGEVHTRTGVANVVVT